MINCPTADSLEQFLTHGFEQGQREWLESHIESCCDCQETLQQISLRVPAKIHPQLLHALSDADMASSSTDEADFFDRLTEEVLARQSSSLALSAEDIVETFSAPELDGYEILEELGHGASGVVFRARHLELDRLVALKIISSAAHLSSESQQRFRHEAQAIARLRHPNIVQVYDYGKKGGYPYLALELIEGDNLARWLAGVPRPAVESARLVEVLAKAISYAHCRGVIHRDLKPSNVLLETKRGEFSGASVGAAAEFGWSEYDLKITDFGLAKIASASSETENQLTQSGTILGTPSYMAPEQVSKHANEIGPAADVYSLGAILYEMLTGRPPFHGATPMETLLLVAHQEPVSIARLAPRVPRDLQTICLKCLEKEVSKRYATASDLAADLERFRKHEPIMARPIGAGQRLLRWARRRPVLAMAMLTIVVLLIATAGMWQLSRFKNAERIQDEEHNLRVIVKLQEEGNWSDAEVRLAQAKARLGTAPSVELRSQLALVERTAGNHALQKRLEDIRLERVMVLNGPFNKVQADEDYEHAFRDAGILDVNDTPATIAARISASPIRGSLLAAMDDWAVCTDNVERRTLLMEAARSSDPDAWRDSVRDPATWDDQEALMKLVKTAPVTDQSVQLLVALSDRLKGRSSKTIEFLDRVQQTYPADFWANYFMGIALTKKKSPEAVGYLRAALAIRPDSAAVYEALGNAFRAAGQIDEGMRQYRKAIQMNPNDGRAYISLGGALKTLGFVSNAIEQYRKAIEIDPNYGWGHYVFGNALREYCRIDDAIKEYRQSITLEPKLTQPHYDLATALTYVGKLSEAQEECQIALRLNPKCAIAYYNLGGILQLQKQPNNAVEYFRRAIECEPKLERAHEALGEALLEIGDFAGAEIATRAALQLVPENDRLYSQVQSQLDLCQQLPRLEQQLPALCSAEDAPVELSNRLAIAKLLYIKQSYDASADQYAKCLAAADQQSETLYRDYGYAAACSATQAAITETNDGPVSNNEQRALNIRRACQWLRTTLKAWNTTLDECQDKASPERVATHSLVLHSLFSWQIDPSLAGLRNSQSIDNLPADQGEACRALWEEWRQTLLRVQDAN